jgi:hypothetical protein
MANADRSNVVSAKPDCRSRPVRRRSIPGPRRPRSGLPRATPRWSDRVPAASGSRRACQAKQPDQRCRQTVRVRCRPAAIARRPSCWPIAPPSPATLGQASPCGSGMAASAAARIGSAASVAASRQGQAADPSIGGDPPGPGQHREAGQRAGDAKPLQQQVGEQRADRPGRDSWHAARLRCRTTDRAGRSWPAPPAGQAQQPAPAPAGCR